MPCGLFATPRYVRYDGGLERPHTGAGRRNGLVYFRGKHHACRLSDLAPVEMGPDHFVGEVGLVFNCFDFWLLRLVI